MSSAQEADPRTSLPTTEPDRSASNPGVAGDKVRSRRTETQSSARDMHPQFQRRVGILSPGLAHQVLHPRS